MLEKYLEQYFGYPEFRPGQKEIISNVLDNKDVLGVLPTGSGKSICYQLPAKLLDGTVVVVSPLIALMVDQVKQLVATGFKEVVAINSFLDFEGRSDVLSNLSSYKLIYISPEMLQNKNVFQHLLRISVSLFVIDEAHCISQWGHEFRPDYLKLHEVIPLLGNPTVLALSATATPDVQKDIIHQLQVPKMKKLIFSMDRDNIAFKVEHCDDVTEKLTYLVDIIGKFPVPTLIYFTSRNWTEKVANILSEKVPEVSSAFYHGGMDQSERLLIQQQFMNGQLDVICCTSAFGMGINKNDVRLIIHFHLPTQIESFIQEVGRAGRDGQSSVSLVLTAPNDNMLPKNLIDAEFPTIGQIEMVCTYLSENDGVIISNDMLLERYQLSESQWRFLYYQLEKSGVIKDNRIVSNNIDLNKIAKQIQSFVNQRKIHKLNKFNDLEKWVHHKEQCRRDGLFSSFQAEVRKAKFMCCDKCDFTFEHWEPRYKSKQVKQGSWQDVLDELFFKGAYE
ncbi:RecQ family ATP-dependent DNA helicase [Aquibacillus salsiterrae]|uniref:ATP-dependent DNA helicase n=1 Tax=Aquibacillus salsiterrae TaxID=2950439 RepID=A0A9X3WDG5_9BACI|nr:ATP-dependent DNA helicase RecQ [Aquibacillus salsiterrae]MDC3415409.1 ATP-dependent DNA helicase [Aquibacillus salsiterrae]